MGSSIDWKRPFRAGRIAVDYSEDLARHKRATEIFREFKIKLYELPTVEDMIVAAIGLGMIEGERNERNEAHAKRDTGKGGEPELPGTGQSQT